MPLPTELALLEEAGFRSVAVVMSVARRTRWWARTSGRSAAGSVKTTWKQGTGSNSASRAASQSAVAAPWHWAQLRFRQEW
jgi:hypothetical protein